MRVTVFIAITFYLHLSHNLFAQRTISGIPQIINYTSANVKEITQTWVIKQDKKGCLYFGNSYGITIFNGKHWEIVKLSNNSAVRSLAISSNGSIYTGGMDELGYLAHNPNGSITYASLVQKLPTQNRDLGIVKDIFAINEDIFFLSDRYLLIYRNNNFVIIKATSNFERGYVVGSRLFVNEKNIGLQELVNNKLSTIPGAEAFTNDAPATLLPMTESKLMAITSNHGAYVIAEQQSIQKIWTHLSNLEITCGLTLSNGQILLGSTHSGLMQLNTEGNVLMTIDKNIGIDNNNITCLFVDCFDNLWVGHDNGVSYIEINNPFSYINEKIVSGAGYASIVLDNNLYLGTSQGLFTTIINGAASQPFLPKLQLIKGTEGRVWSLTKIDNTLFLGHDKGTFIIRENNAVKINDNLGGWNYQKLKSDPNYLIEGSYSGVLLYKKENEVWHCIRRINGFDESCRVFEQDNKGNIWVAHGYKGIYRVTLDEHLTKAQEVKFYGEKNGFPSNLGINVFSIDNKLIFTSEYGGIYNYNETADKFTINSDFESYLGKAPKVSKLFEQQNGNIWVNEIDRTGLLIKQSNGTFKYETQPFNKLKNALIRGFELFGEGPENKTLFGFGSGFICYDQSKQKDYNQKYYTPIHRVELISSKDSVLFQGINPVDQLKADEINLGYKNNSLRFSFSAAYFEDIESIAYTYYLENFDEEWSDFTTKTEREYTNLPEGTYTFHVKSRNLYGTESIESTFTFNINPPWYRTWIAFVSYVVLGFFSITFLTRLYVLSREKKLKQENLLKERELIYLRNLKLHGELESKTKELGTLTTLLVNKNAVLQKVKEYLNTLHDTANPNAQKEITAITRQLDNEADMDKDWQFIEPHFDGVHFGFLSKLKEAYPALKSNDIRLCAYIRMNLSSKEIAVLMNNTTHGVEAHRYRLRKIFKIDRKDNFKEFLNSI
jgi:ligand-binding sensor domain-containing protein